MLALLLLSLLPEEFSRPVVDHAVTAEVNRFYCEESGRLIFTQLILWDRHGVTHWQMLGNSGGQAIIEPGRVRSFHAGEFREYRVDSLQYTDTEYDRELAERKNILPEYRRGLNRRKLPGGQP